MLVRTDVFNEVGGFDEKMNWAEDMDFWRRITRRYEIDLVHEVLVRVRVHPASTTFERSGGASGFERYLVKAFAEDPGLGWSFRKRAKAKMYSKLGQNLLGNGKREQMKLVRQYGAKALKAWPLELSAAAACLASYLPFNLRNSIGENVRRKRYPREKS